MLLGSVAVTCGADMRLKDLERERPAAVVVTAALDEFLGRHNLLAWRGIATHARYVPTEPSEKVTPAYVINRPSKRVPYTRTVETKHATGQSIGGTVIGYEHPGAPARHYPVPTVDHRYERANRELQGEVERRLAPSKVFFCGRLASYLYINQDEAIESALACARKVLTSL
jgi:UDP-galactopyranose mutase